MEKLWSDTSLSAADRLTTTDSLSYLEGMPKLALGKVLKKRKLSKRQFAIRLGVAYHNVFKLFRKGYDPRFSSLVRIAKAVPCRVRDLIDE